MDIERLKELRKKIPEYYGNGFMSLVHCDNMLDLIDDAIARQSVKSEEVAEAIGDLLDMKERWCADSTDNDAISIDLAITALQAYQPWIPVSERLPKNSEHDWVLAQITEDNGYMWIPKAMEYRERIGDWYCEELGWLKTHNGTFKVTHWKPLPEPPKRTDRVLDFWKDED